MQNPHFGLKIKIPKNMPKSMLEISCSVEKAPAENTKYLRNKTILKIRLHAEAIAPKNTQVGSKIKILKKHMKIHGTNHLELFCAKWPS